MSNELNLPQQGDRAAIYASLIPQIEALIEGETSVIANLANTVAALKTAFDFWWVGFYLVEDSCSSEAQMSSNKTELVLGPFQGPVACTRIAKGRGVCGSAWQQQTLIRVDDVDQFPGHIACSAASRSEIVVPIIADGKVQAVLDVDSAHLADFSDIDEQALSRLALSLATSFAAESR